MDQDIQIPNITHWHNLTLTTIDFQACNSFKKTNTIQMYDNCSLEASQNKIMSSAKRRWEIFKPHCLWDLAWKPQRKPPSSILFKNLLNTSIIKRNNNGDRGLPWLIPWELPKKTHRRLVHQYWESNYRNTSPNPSPPPRPKTHPQTCDTNSIRISLLAHQVRLDFGFD